MDAQCCGTASSKQANLLLPVSYVHQTTVKQLIFLQNLQKCGLTRLEEIWRFLSPSHLPATLYIWSIPSLGRAPHSLTWDECTPHTHPWAHPRIMNDNCEESQLHLGDFADAFVQTNFIHTFTHQWLSQPCRATGVVRMRCLAQGHLDAELGQPSGYQGTCSTS